MKVVHGVRIAIAFTITFMIVKALGFPTRSWPLITLVVILVPSDNCKSSVIRALERVAGTFTGAAIGLLAIWVEIHSQAGMLAIMACGSFLCGFFYHSKHPYGALIIGVTMAVVVNAPAGDLKTATIRVAGILLGCVLANLFRVLFTIQDKIYKFE